MSGFLWPFFLDKSTLTPNDLPKSTKLGVGNVRCVFTE